MTISLSPGCIGVPERNPPPQCGPNSDWMPWKSSAPPAMPAAVVAAWRRKPEPAPGMSDGALAAGAAPVGAPPEEGAPPPPDWLHAGWDASLGAERVHAPVEGTLPRPAPPRKLLGAGC